MRIRILQKPTSASIDGIQLDRFRPGCQYEVGNSLGAFLLAQGWAEPIPFDEPALVIPFSETDPFAPLPRRDPGAPPNLVREHYPSYLDEPRPVALDFRKRKRRRDQARK